MSSSIAIPAPRGVSGFEQNRNPTSSSSASSYASSSPQTPGSSKASSPSQSSDKSRIMHQRRPSLLSTAFCQDECTVINIGDPDGPPQIGRSTPRPTSRWVPFRSPLGVELHRTN
ncbi:hypothetical protein PG988_015262 [Apiospora saccharicola]